MCQFYDFYSWIVWHVWPTSWMVMSNGQVECYTYCYQTHLSRQATCPRWCTACFTAFSLRPCAVCAIHHWVCVTSAIYVHISSVLTIFPAWLVHSPLNQLCIYVVCYTKLPSSSILYEYATSITHAQASLTVSLLKDLLVAAEEGRLYEIQSLIDSGRCQVNNEDEVCTTRDSMLRTLYMRILCCVFECLYASVHVYMYFPLGYLVFMFAKCTLQGEIYYGCGWGWGKVPPKHLASPDPYNLQSCNLPPKKRVLTYIDRTLFWYFMYWVALFHLCLMCKWVRFGVVLDDLSSQLYLDLSSAYLYMYSRDV